MRIDHYAVAGRGGVVCLNDGRLPHVESGWRLPEILDAFEPLIGRPTYLRLVGREELGPEHLGWLHVFDTGGAATSGVDPERAVARPLRPALAAWLAEQSAALTPPLRAAWSRPGWRAEAEAWAGCRLEPHRMWALSAVLRGEGVFFKAAPPLFRNEPVITQALARRHPGLVPDVMRIDAERGWLLMGEIRGRLVSEPDSTDLSPALAALAAIQRAWVDRTDEALALGAQDRRRDWPSFGFPDTLTHGDFHAFNVAIASAGAVIFDWTDACVAHPLFDLYTFLAFESDERAHERYVHAYAGAWNRDPDDVANALAGIAPHACRHQEESYEAIAVSVEPDERPTFEGARDEWRERRVTAGREETPPSPDTSH